MKITITLNTDNAAFENEPLGTETARIVQLIASRIEGGRYVVNDGESLSDINGNVVGQVRITQR